MEFCTVICNLVVNTDITNILMLAKPLNSITTEIQVTQPLLSLRLIINIDATNILQSSFVPSPNQSITNSASPPK